MSNTTPQGEQDATPASEDNLEQQEERMESEGQASAPGQDPQPETEPSSTTDLNSGSNVKGPTTTSKD